MVPLCIRREFLLKKPLDFQIEKKKICTDIYNKCEKKKKKKY